MLSSIVQRGSAVLRTAKVAKEVTHVPSMAPHATPKASPYYPSAGNASLAMPSTSAGPTVIYANDALPATPTSSSTKHRAPFSHHHHARPAPMTTKMTTSTTPLSSMAQSHVVMNRPQPISPIAQNKPKVEFLAAPETGAIVEFLAEDGSYRLGLVLQRVEGAQGVWQVSEKLNQVLVHHELPVSRITFYWPKMLNMSAYHFKVEDIMALTEQVQLELENCRSQLALHYGKWIESKAHSVRIENAAELLFNGNPKLHQYYVTHRLLQESDAHVTPVPPTSGASVVSEYTFKPLHVMSSLSKANLQKQQVTDHKLFLHRLARKIWLTRAQPSAMPVEAATLEAYITGLPVLSDAEQRLNLNWNAHKDASFLAQLKAFAFADESAQMSGLLHTKASILDPLDIPATSESVFKLLVQIGVLGKYDNPFVARHSGDPLYFSASQMREHLSKGSSLSHVDRDGSLRRDYRGTGPIFAIDGRLESAEIDDAISYFRSPKDGSTWVHIHIADPSRIVSPNDSLDNLARARVQSVFLPEKVATMFPPNYSRHHFSLLPNQTNYALTFAVQLDPVSGQVLNYEITPSVIDKVVALSYDQADDLLLAASRRQSPKLHAPMHPAHLSALNALLDLSEVRKRYRERSGAVFMDGQWRPEVEVINNGESIFVKSVRDSDSATRAMVSEFMILVGEVTALFARRHQIPIPYRSQAKRIEKIFTPTLLSSEIPSFDASGVTTDLNNLGLLSNLVVPSAVESTSSTTHASTNSSAIAATTTLTPQSSPLKRLQGNATAPSSPSTTHLDAVSIASCSSSRTRLFPAITAVEPAEHAGLGLQAYCQVTSPIRRYTDLVVHHQIKSFLRGEMPPFSAAKITTMLAQVEETQAKLNALASNSNRYWILRFLERQDPAKHYDALVSSDILPSMTYGALQCAAYLTELGWKTPITLSAGRSPLPGDRIQVKIHRIDAFNDDIEFTEVGAELDAAASADPPYTPTSSPSL